MATQVAITTKHVRLAYDKGLLPKSTYVEAMRRIILLRKESEFDRLKQHIDLRDEFLSQNELFNDFIEWLLITDQKFG